MDSVFVISYTRIVVNFKIFIFILQPNMLVIDLEKFASESTGNCYELLHMVQFDFQLYQCWFSISCSLNLWHISYL